MKIAITGSNGFLGRNLTVRLRELGYADLVQIPHDATPSQLSQLLVGVEFVFHLAGVNRPREPQEFVSGNSGFTRLLCEVMRTLPAPPRVVYASSTQAERDNPYGTSKREAEEEIGAYSHHANVAVAIYRLTNVFGKWSRPDYNSAVATFCYRIARDEPIVVHDPDALLRLVYVDDVINAFCSLPAQFPMPTGQLSVAPEYSTTVGDLANCIRAFRDSRTNLVTERVGSGLVRALYATYISCLPPSAFSYQVPLHADPRGVFVELLKTPDCGQFGYFTAHPGVTRGEHYHHTKTEKFLVIKGAANFGFRHLVSNEHHNIVCHGGDGNVVETIPGWTHNVTNIGSDELIVLVWANEIFDRSRPDTVANKVKLA